MNLQEDDESIGRLIRKRAQVRKQAYPDTEAIDEKIMRKLLMRQEHEFNRNARDKNFDPTNLKVVTSDVTKKYTSLDPSEQKILYTTKGLNMEEIAAAERRVIYLELMTRLQTALEIQDRTMYQWTQVFRKEWKWMGNIVMGEDCTKVDSYKNLSVKHLKIMLHQINGSQQTRSQDMLSVKRKSI